MPTKRPKRLTRKELKFQRSVDVSRQQDAAQERYYAQCVSVIDQTEPTRSKLENETRSFVIANVRCPSMEQETQSNGALPVGRLLHTITNEEDDRLPSDFYVELVQIMQFRELVAILRHRGYANSDEELVEVARKMDREHKLLGHPDDILHVADINVN